MGNQLAQVLKIRDRKHTALTLSGRTPEQHIDDVVACDLSDPEAVTNLAKQISAPSTIVHCASSNRGGPDAYRAVYLRGAQNLISAFPNSRLFFTSSTSVYAQTDGSIVTEDCPAEPERESSQILRETEDLILSIGGTVLRLSGIYGPKRCSYIQRLLGNTAIIESGPNPRYLNQIHRDDVAAAIDHLMQQESNDVSGQIYNVTDGHSPTQRECYASLANYLGKPLPLEEPPAKTSKRARTHRRISNAKLTATGWQPKYHSLLDALKNDSRLLVSFT